MTTPTSMNTMRKAAASALLASLLVLGCGGDKPEDLLASARDYLAKNDGKAAVIQLKNALQANPSLAEARYLLGKALLESGDPISAEVELRKALEFKHPADQVVPLLAHTMLLRGQTKKLLDEFSRSELGAPESKADLQATLGQAYLMQGNKAAAEAGFAAALAARPGYPPALLGQVRLAAIGGDVKVAMSKLDALLVQNPGQYEAWQLKGDLLTALGEREAALQAYRKALEVKSDYLPAHALLIAGLLDGNQIDEAARQLELLKKLAPNHPQTVYLQAWLDFRQKNYAAARESVAKHLQAIPDSPLGLQLAGLIEYELKSYGPAESYLLKALPKTPELGMARRMLIATYLRSGQPAKAAGVLQPVLAKIEDNAAMQTLAGEVFMQNGEIEKAGAHFAKAAALDPGNLSKRTSLALAHLARGDSATAFRELEEVAAVDDGSNANLALIAAHLQRNEFDRALKAIAALEKKQPDSPLVHNLRGTALLGKRDVPGARKSFEQALALNPAYFPAAANLANLDLAEKKPAEAKQRFETLLSKDPKNAQAYLALAEFAAKTGGKSDEVAALIGKAIGAAPAEAAPRLALIALYLRAKENKKALSAAQEAQAAMPDSAEILDAVGRAQQAAGDLNQALASFGKLAALQPGSPQPYLRMAEVQVVAKNRDAAMSNLRKALEIRPDLVEAQRGVILLELDAGRLQEALAVARQIQKQRPKEALGYVLEGDIHATKKSWSEAIAAFRAGLKQVAVADLAIKLHSALGVSGNKDEANRFSDTWLREHPKDAQFRLYLAETANARKDYATSTKFYRALVDAQPENPTLLNNLAWAAAQTGDPKAVEYAEKANRLAPGQPAIMDTLGVLLVERGESGRGLELLQKAVELAPQASEIRLNYARALLKTGKKGDAKLELDTLAKLGDKFPAHAEVAQLLKSL